MTNRSAALTPCDLRENGAATPQAGFDPCVDKAEEPLELIRLATRAGGA